MPLLLPDSRINHALPSIVQLACCIALNVLHIILIPASTDNAMVCRLGPQVVVRTYEGAEHTEILTNDAAVADLLNILHEDYAPLFLERLFNTVSSFRGRKQF